MPTLPLRKVASVRMGTTLRGRDATRPDPAGPYRMIQIGDLADDGTFRNIALTTVTLRENPHPDQLLCPGDVIFPNRGSRTTAAVFEGSDRKTLVGAQFFIITPDPKNILPAYLAWLLRTAEAFTYFEAHRRGSNVLTLPKDAIANFPVPLPSLETQRIIASIIELQLDESAIESRLAKLRFLHLEQSLLQRAKIT